MDRVCSEICPVLLKLCYGWEHFYNFNKNKYQKQCAHMTIFRRTQTFLMDVSAFSSQQFHFFLCRGEGAPSPSPRLSHLSTVSLSLRSKSTSLAFIWLLWQGWGDWAGLKQLVVWLWVYSDQPFYFISRKDSTFYPGRVKVWTYLLWGVCFCICKVCSYYCPLFS